MACKRRVVSLSFTARGQYIYSQLVCDVVFAYKLSSRPVLYLVMEMLKGRLNYIRVLVVKAYLI